MTPGWLMAILAVAAVMLQATLIHFLNNRIPSAYIQRETGEQIIGRRSFKDISDVREEFELYFYRVRLKVRRALELYVVLTVIVFFLFQGFFYAVPLPPPRPGPLVVPIHVVSAFLTLFVTSFGWVKVALERAQTRLLRQEIIDKYIIMGVFEPDSLKKDQ